jgi:hypothetical protein
MALEQWSLEQWGRWSNGVGPKEYNYYQLLKPGIDFIFALKPWLYGLKMKPSGLRLQACSGCPKLKRSGT